MSTKELALSEVQKDPHNAVSWFHLATCYLGEGDFEGTIEPLKKALSIDDGRDEWVRMLAECYIALKRWNEAAPLIMRLLRHPDWTLIGPSGERVTLREGLEACMYLSASQPASTSPVSPSAVPVAPPSSSKSRPWFKFWK